MSLLKKSRLISRARSPVCRFYTTTLTRERIVGECCSRGCGRSGLANSASWAGGITNAFNCPLLKAKASHFTHGNSAGAGLFTLARRAGWTAALPWRRAAWRSCCYTACRCHRLTTPWMRSGLTTAEPVEKKYWEQGQILVEFDRSLFQNSFLCK